MKRQLKVALVYDRVNKWGGAERVLLVLHELFPDAPLFTSVYSQDRAEWAEVFPNVIPSFLQKIPFAKDNHEYFASLMPLAFRSHNIKGYDVVISVTSEFAKAVRTDGIHICYCLTPTRYLWSSFDDYFKNPMLRIGSTPLISFLKNWDRKVAQEPDAIVSISKEVRKRVKDYYGRNSKIIFPPVEVEKFNRRKGSKRKGDFYLVVSRLVSYKKVDLVIEVFNELGYPLIIVGKGKEEKNLKKIANRNIKFASELTDNKLRYYYSNCKALVFPQLEDFGIVAVEAQAAGAPVIAYKKGGALDTVIDGKTGIFFKKQNRESLIEAIKRFEKMKFGQGTIVANAKRFSVKRFKKEFLTIVESIC
ncbi:MAG TPA: glycosyltransferase [Patescibacteria group bacterium]